jgi:GxxExxY protein
MQVCIDTQGCAAAILPLTEYDLGYDGDHAALGETSLLAVRPDLVRLEAVAPDMPLEGIIGEDPRRQASAARGAELLEAIVERAAEMVQRFSASGSSAPSGLDRRPAYLAALQAGVDVLEEIQHQRQALSKAAAAPIVTPPYRQYCQAWRLAITNRPWPALQKNYKIPIYKIRKWGCVYRVSNTLGTGFLEKVCENALAHELQKTGLKVQQQHPTKVWYDGIVVDDYVADPLIEDCILVELKAVKALDDLLH